MKKAKKPAVKAKKKKITLRPLSVRELQKQLDEIRNIANAQQANYEKTNQRNVALEKRIKHIEGFLVL